MTSTLNSVDWPSLSSAENANKTGKIKPGASRAQRLSQQKNATTVRLPNTLAAVPLLSAHEGNPSIGASSMAINLHTLPEDLHHIIITDLLEISPRTIASLAQTCRTIRRIASPYTYHTLELSNKSSSKFSLKLGPIIKDVTDRSIVKHIRKIIVKDGHSTEDLTTIVEKIAIHGRLKFLSWETSVHIPEVLLQRLTNTWPDLNLIVRITDRWSTNPLGRAIDTRLISSPLLHTLIYSAHILGYHTRWSAHTDWPLLTRCLSSGNSVRVLIVQSRPAKGSSNHVSTNGPQDYPRLTMTPNLRLPPLEELSLSLFGNDTQYGWDEKYCSALRDSMDWSRLRKLHFNNSIHAAFFEGFEGLLPQLKSLRFGFSEQETQIASSLEPARRFIESVDALQCLDINNARKGLDVLWPSIASHKRSLKRLILGSSLPTHDPMDVVDLKLLRTIAKEFPLLEHFGCKVPFGKMVELKYMRPLAAMRLTKLDLFMHTANSNNAWTKKVVDWCSTEQHVNKEGSRDAATAIMETMSRAQKRPLRRLTMHLRRAVGLYSSEPAMACFQYRLMDGVARKYELRGKLDFGRNSFEDELRMEEE